LCGLRNNTFRKYFFYFFSLLLIGKISAQRIVNFKLLQVENSVNTRFTLAAGVTCYGYKIYHSLDSINFVEIYDYPAICGESGSDEYFSDVHATPTINKLNYYKIQLSTFESSPVEKIFVASGTPGKIVVFPNPTKVNAQEVYLRIYGKSNLKVDGVISDLQGKQIKHIEVLMNGDLALLNIHGLNDGLYFLRLHDGQQIYKGKFLIEQ